jgi:hypothetical protein
MSKLLFGIFVAESKAANREDCASSANWKRTVGVRGLPPLRQRQENRKDGTPGHVHSCLHNSRTWLVAQV